MCSWNLPPHNGFLSLAPGRAYIHSPPWYITGVIVGQCLICVGNGSYHYYTTSTLRYSISLHKYSPYHIICHKQRSQGGANVFANRDPHLETRLPQTNVLPKFQPCLFVPPSQLAAVEPFCYHTLDTNVPPLLLNVGYVTPYSNMG